jgi:HD-GYP domain-containing protein (c-di-GMP phosphodiesterase class II)
MVEEKNKLEILLDLHRQLDDKLDEGMVKRSPFIPTLRKTITEVLSILKEFEKTTGAGESFEIFTAYINHFNEIVAFSTNTDDKSSALSKLNEILKDRKLIRDDIKELESITPVYKNDIIIVELRVFDEFLGVIVLAGNNLDEFHREYISLLARKIDTDIYQNNQYTLEKLKLEGIEKINQILDSDIPLHKKYREIVKILVDNVDAYGAFLILPREGNLRVSTRYVKTDAHFKPDKNQIMDIAGRFIKTSGPNVLTKDMSFTPETGQIYGIILKPEDREIEGILLVHHENMSPGHLDVITACSLLIDSSLHVNHVYSKVFENFLEVLSILIDTLEPDVKGHAYRVTTYSMALGKACNLARLEMAELRIASVLHHVEKIKNSPSSLWYKLSAIFGKTGHELYNADKNSATIDDIIPFDLRDIKKLIDIFNDSQPVTIDRNSPLHNVSCLAKIIAAADIFDTITADNQNNRHINRLKAADIMTTKAPHLSDLAELLKADDTWEIIRNEFQSVKIRFLFDDYTGEMLPDLENLISELETVKSCLEDLHKLRKNFEKGEEISLSDLEKSSLSSLEKDNLIQREAQKNTEFYLNLLQELEFNYRNRMNILEAKRNVENRFKERFWNQSYLDNIMLTAEKLIEDGADFYVERPDISAKFSGNEFLKNSDSLHLMDITRTLLNKSGELKGLNQTYIAPLRTLLEVFGYV